MMPKTAPLEAEPDRVQAKINLDKMFEQLFESKEYLQELQVGKKEVETVSLDLQENHGDQKKGVDESWWRRGPPNVLQGPLLPLRRTLRVLGVVPYVYDADAGKYDLSWRRAVGIHVLTTAAFFSVLLVTSAVGIVRMFVFPVSYREDENARDIKLMGVVILTGCLINSWASLFNVVYAGRRLVCLLNAWNAFVAETDVNPTEGLRAHVRAQVAFLVVFSAAFILMILTGYPQVVTHVIDGVAESFFMIPHQWLISSPLGKILRVVVCAVCLHIFAIFKGSLFSFTTNCQMLKNGFTAWNKQLSSALDGESRGAKDEWLKRSPADNLFLLPPDIWRRHDRTRGRLGLLVQSHWHLVSLVRQTEAIFGPMLQCYYASTVVILCTELYLLAYRIGSQEFSVDGVVTTTLLTLQTAAVFVMVSLSAGAVEEVANDSVDVLRRGLPFDTSERDKFNRDELTVALTGSQICITGGRFFVINRPFIITVISAVLTYFIVMIQIMRPGSGGSQTAFLNDTATNFTLV